jgi:hypothetical protein
MTQNLLAKLFKVQVDDGLGWFDLKVCEGPESNDSPYVIEYHLTRVAASYGIEEWLERGFAVRIVAGNVPEQWSPYS